MANEQMILTNPISFGAKLAASGNFKSLFDDGMSLVEDTAAYLDGEGRDDAKRLPRTAALVYASESMRLTTRLMQIASWLLLQRAVNEGEMTQAEAASDKRRTRISWQQAPRPVAAADALPQRLSDLIETSLRLQERISRLDGLLTHEAPAVPQLFGPRPIELQMSMLREAFSA